MGVTREETFIEAIKAGDLALVEDLLGAEPALLAARDADGASAILVSVYHDRAAVRRLLLAREPQLDVFEAAAVGDAARLRALLARDRSLANSHNRDGFTPLGLAAFFGHPEAADVLLEAGADVNARSRNRLAMPPLHSAIARGDARLVRTLLRRGADVHATHGSRVSSLHAAAFGGNVEILRLLVEHGARLDATTDDGKTPLDVAEERGQAEAAALLRSEPG